MTTPTTRRRGGRLLGAVLAAATVAAAGCGTGGAETAATGPVDLRMTVWTANEQQLALFDEIAAAYVAAHPEEVRSVTFESLPFDGYTTALTTQVAGGNAPDLAWILESTAPEFVGSGALAPLGGALRDTEGYAFDDLNADALALWTSGDELYAYPFSTSPFAVFVNTDLLARAGAPAVRDLVDGGGWTWDAVAGIAEQVRAGAGVPGFVVRDFEYTAWEYLATVWSGWGARAWSPDYATCELDRPEMVAAMTYLRDAAVSGAMPGPGASADFFAGEAAMTVTQISRASLLDDSFAWDVVPLPAGPAGQADVFGQAGIGVFADSPAAAVATDFLAFFTAPDNAEELAAYFPPPRTSLLNAEVLAASNPKLSAAQLDEVVVQAVDGATTKPAHPRFAEIQQAVRAELDALWTPGSDVAAVLSSACDAIDPLMAG
jgi:multiple sugar transport system substrate-binding protein